MVETLTATVGLLAPRPSVLGQPPELAEGWIRNEDIVGLSGKPVVVTSPHLHITPLFWTNPSLNHYEHMSGIPTFDPRVEDPAHLVQLPLRPTPFIVTFGQAPELVSPFNMTRMDQSHHALVFTHYCHFVEIVKRQDCVDRTNYSVL